jgi:hypothetical protein
MRKAISLALMMFAVTVCAWAQSAPKILMISRVNLKEGRAMEYQKLDRQVRQVVHKNDPSLNWITATAFTGNDNEETYFQFLNSYAEIEQANTAFGKAAGTLFMSADFNQTVADSQEAGRNIIAKLREDLSYNADKFDPANAKFWSITYSRLKPGSDSQLTSIRQDINAQLKAANYDLHYLVYQVSYGMPSATYLIVRDLPSLSALDVDTSKQYDSAVAKNLRQQYTAFSHENAVAVESVIYEVKPELSHPPLNLVAANPSFWTVKESEAAPVVAKKGKGNKQAVEPAAVKENK